MKSLLLFISIILGIIFFTDKFNFLVKYLVMVMFFISSSQVRLNFSSFRKNILFVLLVNILLGFVLYYGLVSFHKDLAMVAFIVALMPTAMVTPAIVSYLKGDIEYVTTAVILSNIAISLLLPLFMKLVNGPADISMVEMFVNIFTVAIIPLFLAQVVRYLFPTLNKVVVKYKDISFIAWVLIIFFALSNSSFFLHTHKNIPTQIIIGIGIVSLVLCVLCFALGRLIGGKKFALEASQALGQKNTMFMIWFSLTYLSPLIALGPVFYLIYHNLYNSYLMYRK